MPSSRAVQTLLLLPDPRETPLGEVSNAGLGRGVHTPYGHAEPLLAARTGFNGQPREACGWYQLGSGHRVYNPKLMRFHSPDRLSPFDKGGLNAYAYCLGDPVNFTDPSGRFVMQIPGLLMDHFTEYPVSSALHNAALLVGGFLTNIAIPPAGLAVLASSATMFGATFGLAGAAVQFAGNKEVGGALALAGVTLSAVASVTRLGLAARKAEEVGALTSGEVWKRTKNMLFGGYKVKPVPKPASTSLPARRYSAPGQLETEDFIPPPKPKLSVVDELPVKNANRRKSIAYHRRDSIHLGGMDQPGKYHKVNPAQMMKITE